MCVYLIFALSGESYFGSRAGISATMKAAGGHTWCGSSADLPGGHAEWKQHERAAVMRWALAGLLEGGPAPNSGASMVRGGVFIYIMCNVALQLC